MDGVDFIVDDLHRVMVKAIQKTGATTWRTLLVNIARKVNKVEKQIAFFSRHEYNLIGLHITDEYPLEEAIE